MENVDFKRGKGCYQCIETGYKGRTGIFEVLANDEMIQELILKRKSAQEITRAAVEAGKLRTLKDDAATKVIQGITTLEEAASAVMVAANSSNPRAASSASRSSIEMPPLVVISVMFPTPPPLAAVMTLVAVCVSAPPAWIQMLPATVSTSVTVSVLVSFR